MRTIFPLVGLFAAAVAGTAIPPIVALETSIRDLEYALLAPSAPAHPRLVVLDVDEDTVAKFGQRSPIDRFFLADLITFAAKAEPSAMGIDILIDRPATAESDEALMSALRAVDVPVVLAWAESASAPNAIEPRQEASLRAFYARIENPKVTPGVVNLRPDADGVVRSMVLRTDAGTVREGFALALNRLAGGRIPEGREQPLSYYGHPGVGEEPINRIPAHVFMGRTDDVSRGLERAMKGKVVLIGASLLDADRHRTPFSADPLGPMPTLPGVEIQAQAVAQLLDGRTAVESPLWALFVLAGLSVGAGYGIGSREGADLTRLIAASAAALSLVAVTGLVFRYGAGGAAPGPSLPLITPILGVFAAATLGISSARRRIARDRSLVFSVLSRYVPAAAVDEQLRHPNDMRLGGDQREMSFVFTDIAGFTKLCETTPPARLVPMLNAYLAGMSEIITRHGGTVGGFIGDAVVAFWGAPTPDPDHPAHALTAAIAMSGYAKAQRNEARNHDLDFGRTRIGVHTGIANVGNFGGAGHLEYMAHGDVVNTTSRLEGANKFLGTLIAVSAATADRVRNIRLRPAADLLLKGKNNTMSVFEPAPDMPEAQFKAYVEAYDLMREGSPSAPAIFEQLHRQWPSDRLVEVHLKRLRKGEIGSRIKLRRK